MAPADLKDIVQQLLETISISDDIDDSEALSILRKQIDQLDIAILHILNGRSECANQIGELKKRLDRPVYAPGRESQVLHNVQSSNPGPLQNDAIRRLFERIIDETRSLERKLFQEDNNVNDKDNEV